MQLVGYSRNQIKEINEELHNCAMSLQRLRGLYVGIAIHEPESTREYLLHGVARRLAVIRHSLLGVFTEFPVEAKAKIEKDRLMRAQINLHAFLINVIGVFDNMAWSFVWRHNALDEIGGRLQVDLFKQRLQSILPDSIRLHLQSDDMKNWHKMYMKNYRDALAHRIPPYIPPSTMNEGQRERFETLQGQRIELITQGKLDEADELEEEQESIGSPCYHFLHSFSENDALRPIQMHPQLLSDVKTVIEFGDLFLAHWRDRTPSDA